MSATLTLGLVAPAVNVQAQPKNQPISIENLQLDRYAPGNVEKIIEMLRKTGKISANATQEEMQKALQEYLKNDPAAQEELNKKQKEVNKKWSEYAKQYGLKQDDKNSLEEVEIKGTEIQYVQTEKYNGVAKEIKPLVVLIDFKDVKHGDIKAEDSEFYFDDYTKEHYEEMIFGKDGYKGPSGQTFISMRQFYEEQSGGSYTISGDIAGWYTANENMGYYGEDKDGSNNYRMRTLVKEALDKVAADKNFDLADYDHKDNFSGAMTPDGIIDHIIIVHAGVGQETGTLDTNTIWSHSSLVYDVVNNEAYPHIFKDYKGRTWGSWGYTTNPEDGAAGVFIHEFGHDLGVPDEYDTNYTGSGSAVGDWSIMCNGSWTGKIGGTEPSGFSPEHKQYFQARYGGNWISGQTIKLEDINAQGMDFLVDQANSRGTNNDVIRIDLPKSERKINEVIEGKYDYYGGKDSNLNSSMSTTVDLTSKTSAQLKFKTIYDIEKDWDYASVQVRVVGQSAWTSLKGKTTTDKNPNEQNPGNAFTGDSKGWIDEEISLDAYAGKNIELKFQYSTDAYTEKTGFFVDSITIVSGTEIILADNAETESKFKLEGFVKFDGYVEANHYYLIEWRNHQGSDAGLAHASRGLMSYDPGMLIWYIDEFYGDNWTGDPSIPANEGNGHPGYAHTGVVDADKTPIVLKSHIGKPDAEVSSTLNMHDAAFSLRRSSTYFFNSAYYNGIREDKSTFMHPYFDDNRSYNDSMAPSISRILENYGLKIYVTGESKDRSVGKIHIARTTK
jgi:immune inhibitor A